MSIQRACAPRAARGFTLIEALVALLVLSIGLLGVAALQLTSLQNNSAAAIRTQATYLAYDIADRMRANRKDALAGLYNFDFDTKPDAGSAVQAHKDVGAWKNVLAVTLPGGAGEIDVDADGVAVIRIRWSDSRDPADAPLVFVTRTRI